MYLSASSLWLPHPILGSYSLLCLEIIYSRSVGFGCYLKAVPVSQYIGLCCVSLQFVSDGLFRSELNSFLKQELAEDGYSGVEVRVTPTRTEIIILATRTQNVLGEKGRRIRELTAVVQKRFNFPEGTVEVRLTGQHWAILYHRYRSYIYDYMS